MNKQHLENVSNQLETTPRPIPAWLLDLKNNVKQETFAYEIIHKFFDGASLSDRVEFHPAFDSVTIRDYGKEPVRYELRKSDQRVLCIWEGSKFPVQAERSSPQSLKKQVKNVFVPDRKVEPELRAGNVLQKIQSYAEVDLNTFQTAKTRINSRRSAEIILLPKDAVTETNTSDSLSYFEDQTIITSIPELFPSINNAFKHDIHLSFRVGNTFYEVIAIARYDIQTNKLNKVILRAKNDGLENSFEFNPENEVNNLGWEGMETSSTTDDGWLPEVAKPKFLKIQAGEAVIEINLSWVHPAIPSTIRIRFASKKTDAPKRLGYLDPIIPQFAHLASSGNTY